MGHRLLAFSACLLLWGSAARAEGDWPQFRGPSGQGLSEASGVPTEWGSSKHVAWKVEMPGQGWSSPVLAAGKIYLTTAGGAAGRAAALYAVCLEAETGKILWNTEVFQPNPAAVKQMHPKNSPASATPIVTADRLYVHFGHMGTAALDLTGKVLWKQTSLSYSPVHGTGSSPVLVDGLLVFNCDAGAGPFLAALDANSGEVRWKAARDSAARKKFSFCTPLVIETGGAKQVISPGSGYVGAYEPATGKEIWRVRYGEGYSVVPRPVYSHGILFLSSGFDAAVMYAIRPEGAKGDVTASNVVWTQRKSAPNTPSPLAVGDEVYFVSDKGSACCVDAVSGKEHWTHRLEGDFSASPVAAGGNVYFQSESGVGFVVKAGKTFEQVARNDLEERSLASYAVGDGALYIRTEKHLWKIAGGK